jgi:hypothetical protein
VKIGDRVIVNGEQDGIEFKNAAGTVIDIDDAWRVHCIEFDEYNNLGSFYGGKPGHCWHVPDYMVNFGDYKEDPMKERIEVLEKELAALKAQLGKKYAPKNGRYYISGAGEVLDNDTAFGYLKTGRRFDTKEKAEKARDIMVKHDIILKYVIDHAPNFDRDTGELWSVWYDTEEKEWTPVLQDTGADIGTIIMPEWVAEKLADDLNNNRIDGI